MKDVDKKKVAAVVVTLRAAEKSLETLKEEWEEKVGELEEKDTGSSIEQAEELQEEIDALDQHLSNFGEVISELEGM